MDIPTFSRIIFSKVLVRLFSFGIFVFLLARFAYIATLTPTFSTTVEDHSSILLLRKYYSSVFKNLIADNFLSLESKALCIQIPKSQDVIALQEIGVVDSVGVYKRSPLPFENSTFDFVFAGYTGLDRVSRPARFASEVCRILKPGGFFVVHTGTNDVYSLNSLIDLFGCCKLVRSRTMKSLFPLLPRLREIILKKIRETRPYDRNSTGKCAVSGIRLKILRNCEELITKEPLEPWITFKRNRENITYLTSMVDINFRNRYIYIDVGSRNYRSSIGSWFKKHYPKQNKRFEIYAVEADCSFYDEYRSKKKIKLLPYAAWVKNETLFFKISQKLNKMSLEKVKEMERFQPFHPSSNFLRSSDRIEGFDFANWLKNTVNERDFVVLKIDLEGAEFHLVPKLIESGAVCLIDEMFLECHYNRWQKCCNGTRNSKYQKTYEQCLLLFSSLRKKGVLVHQWG